MDWSVPTHPKLGQPSQRVYIFILEPNLQALLSVEHTSIPEIDSWNVDMILYIMNYSLYNEYIAHEKM